MSTKEDEFMLATKVLAAGVLIVAAQIDPTPVDQQRAEMYFREAKELCDRDNGRLWGVSLCGPMVFADARTRTIATSQPAPRGDQPRSIGFANAPIEWAGMRWAAYIWSFIPEDRRQRGELLMHELFHRIQPQLGLMAQTVPNAHLDTLDGRYWLQLEWRALAAGLRSSGDERTVAMRDALAFRKTRRALFPDAAENERRSEIQEGLAQYTGTVVTANSSAQAAESTLAQLSAAEKQESFVDTAAYTAGVAYGVLLDSVLPEWRRGLQVTSDLAQVLMVAARLQPADDASSAAARYRGIELRTAETERDRKLTERIAELRQRFVDGPVLILPGNGAGTFDIRGAIAIPRSGTVYFSTYRIAGDWGSFEASTGVLVSPDRSTRTLPGPFRTEGRTLIGDGWTVTLASGWVVRSGPRPSDSQVVRDGR
jgi:hypothetical protein